MPPVMNPMKSDTMQGKTNAFGMSGFHASVTGISRASEPAALTDALLLMCEHAKTDNVKVISDILL